MTRTGRCLCGQLQYRVVGALGPIVNCHCQFCRRVHGAPFATLAFIPASAFEWLAESGEISEFVTAAGHIRSFCAACSSPICNFAGGGVELASLVVGSLAEEFQLAPWFHINLESKSPWFEIGDDLPRFDGSPEATNPKPAVARLTIGIGGDRHPLASLRAPVPKGTPHV